MERYRPSSTPVSRFCDPCHFFLASGMCSFFLAHDTVIQKGHKGGLHISAQYEPVRAHDCRKWRSKTWICPLPLQASLLHQSRPSLPFIVFWLLHGEATRSFLVRVDVSILSCKFQVRINLDPPLVSGSESNWRWRGSGWAIAWDLRTWAACYHAEIANEAWCRMVPMKFVNNPLLLIQAVVILVAWCLASPSVDSAPAKGPALAKPLLGRWNHANRPLPNYRSGMRIARRLPESCHCLSMYHIHKAVWTALSVLLRHASVLLIREKSRIDEYLEMMHVAPQQLLLRACLPYSWTKITGHMHGHDRPGTNLKAGIVGMPNVGKSSFFNLLCKMSVPAENFPFCTIDPTLRYVCVCVCVLYYRSKLRYLWLCLYVYVHTHVYMHTYIHSYILRVCIYISMHIHIDTYIHTWAVA